MSVINPRNRLVNFRLSEAEFEALRVACQAMGARSISEFARSAVLEKMSQSDGSDAGRVRVFQLDHKVAELETKVGQLLSLLSATGTSVVPEPVAVESGVHSGY
jgi:predicted DNA-binding transcriptional regulator YafY